MKSIQTKEKINSLQALRAVAFLGIFLLHANFFFSWPYLGVSVFYVMSGFLMTYRYAEDNLIANFKNNLKFAIDKIKKLYPLHIITMICAIILDAAVKLHNGFSLIALAKLVLKIILNIVLLQTWVPNCYISVSLNGVAWYLSVTMFLYFIFPWIKNMVERISIIKLSVISALILIIEILACIPFIKIVGNESHIYIWFMYCFPVFRLGDFFIGCVSKRIFFELDFKNIGAKKATVYECVAATLTAFVFIWLKRDCTNVFELALHNWTTIYIPLAFIWVMLFAANKGLITKLLTNKLTLFIGNISAYAFLIHYVITQYMSALLKSFEITLGGWSLAIIVFIELIITIIFSIIYKKIHDKYIAKFLS